MSICYPSQTCKPHNGLQHLAVGTRFNIVTLVFFVPYILLSVLTPALQTSYLPNLSELPGNIALRKFGVRRWMTFITFGFGSVQLGMGFVNRWGYLALCRVFLGIFEVRCSSDV